MALDIYNWIELTDAISKIPPKTTFLQTNVFTTKRFHTTDTIAWEVLTGTNQISKFKSKFGEPNAVGTSTREVKSATLPRIFEKKVFEASDLQMISNAVNVVPTGANQIISKADELLLYELTTLKDRIINTIEWQCAKALSTGELTMVGDDVTYYYNYGYESGKQIVDPTADWSGSSAKIKKDLLTWKKMIYSRTGQNPSICLLGTEAANVFVDSPEVQKALDTLNYKVGALNLNEGAKSGAIYLGTFLGIDFYEYAFNINGEEAFGSKLAILLAKDNTYQIHYGGINRIQDGKNQVYVQDILVQTLQNQYNTAVEIIVESKPLPIIHNPDLVVVSQVIA